MTEIEMPEPNSSLGEKLLIGVRNLWARVIALETAGQRTEKVVAHQGTEIEEIKGEIVALRRQVHGLKTSRGRTRAKNVRLERQITEAEITLSEAERRVH
jgi:chromosome segregation ATPase